MTDKLQRTTGVLIVDDDLLARRAIAEYLSLVSDFTVQGAAATAEEALALVQDSPPDMVLLDVRMPGMDGIEACARIRQLAPDAIIIMMTSFDDEDLLRRAVAAGASGYLLKNVRAAQLIVALRAAPQGLPAMSPELLSIERARSDPAGPPSDEPGPPPAQP